LPFGAVISPQPGGALLPQCNAAPPACAKCGAYINSFVATTPDTGEWHCTFCMHHNPEAAQPIAGHDAVDYLVAPPAGASPPSPPPLRVLALDLASPQAELDGIKAAAAAALDAAPDHTRIALMAYGRALSVFRLGGGGGGGGGGAGPAVHADVLPPDSEEAGQGTEVLEAEVHSAQLGECRGRLAAALRSLRCQPSSAGGLASLGAAVAAAGALGERVQALAAAPSAFDTPASQAMQRQQARSTAHVIVLTAAPSAAPRGQAGGSDGEEGEEASGYLEDVAAAAADRGVAVDVLPSGPPGAAAVLSELALGSGGVMRAHRGAASALGASLGAALAREAGLACGLEVRCSSGLSVRGAVGPLAPVCLAGKPARDWRDAGLPRHMLSPRTWHYLCSAPEARQGATLLLQGDPLASPSQRHVYIQVTLTWAQPDGSARRRVATKRLAATQDPDDVARATDFQVAAVLLASTLAAEAMGRQAAYDRKEAEILRRQLGAPTPQPSLRPALPRTRPRSSHAPLRAPRLFFLVRRKAAVWHRLAPRRARPRQRRLAQRALALCAAARRRCAGGDRLQHSLWSAAGEEAAAGGRGRPGAAALAADGRRAGGGGAHVPPAPARAAAARPPRRQRRRAGRAGGARPGVSGGSRF
jgi:hypothetical protein